MAHSFKRNGRSIILGFSSLALTAFAGQAMAQDYCVKLKRTADISVETEYASIKKQIKEYCHKMERGPSSTTQSRRSHRRQQCQDVVMAAFLKKMDEPIMLAYHNGSRLRSSTTTKLIKNNKSIKTN